MKSYMYVIGLLILLGAGLTIAVQPGGTGSSGEIAVAGDLEVDGGFEMGEDYSLYVDTDKDTEITANGSGNRIYFRVGGGSDFGIIGATTTLYGSIDIQSQNLYSSTTALNLGADYTPSTISDDTGSVSVGQNGASDSIEVQGKAVFAGNLVVDIFTITQADLTANSCTLGQISIDTGGATKELCACTAADDWDCIDFTTLDGPGD